MVAGKYSGFQFENQNGRLDVQAPHTQGKARAQRPSCAVIAAQSRSY